MYQQRCETVCFISVTGAVVSALHAFDDYSKIFKSLHGKTDIQLKFTSPDVNNANYQLTNELNNGVSWPKKQHGSVMESAGVRNYDLLNNQKTKMEIMVKGTGCVELTRRVSYVSNTPSNTAESASLTAELTIVEHSDEIFNVTMCGKYSTFHHKI